MELREDQDRSLARAHAYAAKGARRILLVAPTGFGKTVTLGEAVRRSAAKGKRVAWFAHRRELVLQAAKTLAGFGLDVGFSGYNRSALVQVATVQGAQAGDQYPPADVVVLDEAHHFVSDEWGELPARYPDQIILGGTATPERGDGRPLGKLFQAMVVCAQISELQERGTLVHLDIRRPARMLRSNEIAQHPVDAYCEHARGQRAVVFAQSVQRARDFADQFRAAGIKVACVFGETPTEERDAILARYARGDLDVLCNVAVLTEGWDCPPASCCILARGIGSFSLMVQMVGRVLRAYPGKTGALLLDLRGVTHDLGRPDDDADYALSGECGMWRKGAAPIGVRLCPICQNIIPAGILKCEVCGKDVGEKPLVVTNEKLVYWKEKLAQDPPHVRLIRLENWVGDCIASGKKPESARFKYRAVYGYMPREVDFFNAKRRVIGNALIRWAATIRDYKPVAQLVLPVRGAA